MALTRATTLERLSGVMVATTISASGACITSLSISPPRRFGAFGRSGFCAMSFVPIINRMVRRALVDVVRDQGDGALDLEDVRVHEGVSRSQLGLAKLLQFQGPACAQSTPPWRFHATGVPGRPCLYAA